MHLKETIIFFIVLLLLVGCKQLDNENRYQIGTAHVSLTLIDGEESWPDSLIVNAVYPTVLSVEQANLTSYTLQYDGEKWVGDVPLEVLKCESGTISVFLSDSTFITGVICGFDQDRPKDVKIKCEKDGKYAWSMSNEDNYKCFNYIDGSYFINYIEAFIRASDESYKSWQSYIACEMDSIAPKRIEMALSGTTLDPTLRKIVEEQFMQYYFKGRITWYVKDAKKFADLDVSDPPTEMYKRYLDRLNLSPDVVIDEAIPELFFFYQCFFNDLPINIPDINECEVAEWQSVVLPELKKVLSYPTPVFLDKLSAVAYISQIEQRNRPLSQQQIENINAYYKDDLGKIIINRNQKVVEKLKNAQSELIDLSDQEDFNLMDFLKQFEDRPVVVDFWNTWCGPCISAMKEFEERKGEYRDSDIVFLYICNTSSPEQDWRRYAERESGFHIRLNEVASQSLSKYYDINAIPSYLFFDKDHELKDKFTGFPGNDGFVASLSKIGQ